MAVTGPSPRTYDFKTGGSRSPLRSVGMIRLRVIHKNFDES
jgi:hypothetical protein